LEQQQAGAAHPSRASLLSAPAITWSVVVYLLDWQSFSKTD
jgi:hypothetical protein